MWIITLEYLEWFLKLNQQFIDRYSKFCYNAIVERKPLPNGAGSTKYKKRVDSKP